MAAFDKAAIYRAGHNPEQRTLATAGEAIIERANLEPLRLKPLI
jgi:hypothetical protein